MRPFSVHMDPPANRPCPANQPQVCRALLHRKALPLLINSKCTEPYYTKLV